jgi:hypothetical protein
MLSMPPAMNRECNSAVQDCSVHAWISHLAVIAPHFLPQQVQSGPHLQPPLSPQLHPSLWSQMQENLVLPQSSLFDSCAALSAAAAAAWQGTINTAEAQEAHPHLQTGQLGSWPFGAIVSGVLREQSIVKRCTATATRGTLTR